MKKISFIGGNITIYPDRLEIEQKAFFSPKKTATLFFSDIKSVSGPFDRLHIEGSSERFSLWFGAGGNMRVLMAKKVINTAMKEAGF
jgi:hypothetical protein